MAVLDAYFLDVLSSKHFLVGAICLGLVPPLFLLGLYFHYAPNSLKV